MKNVTYVVRGHETAKCWQDDANMKVVHGPSEALGDLADVAGVPALANAYFARFGTPPTSTDFFVSVTEQDKDGKNLGQRIFTPVDFSRGSFSQEVREALMAVVATQLVERGMTMGVSH